MLRFGMRNLCAQCCLHLRFYFQNRPRSQPTTDYMLLCVLMITLAWQSIFIYLVRTTLSSYTHCPLSYVQCRTICILPNNRFDPLRIPIAGSSLHLWNACQHVTVCSCALFASCEVPSLSVALWIQHCYLCDLWEGTLVLIGVHKGFHFRELKRKIMCMSR